MIWDKWQVIGLSLIQIKVTLLLKRRNSQVRVKSPLQHEAWETCSMLSIERFEIKCHAIHVIKASLAESSPDMMRYLGGSSSVVRVLELESGKYLMSPEGYVLCK